MIPVFRKIRQGLFSSGKFRSYLGYALGEIILVVIGILIALQINNWNEDHKDRIKEQKILVSLQEDFRYTQHALETSLSIYPEEIERLDSSLHYIGMQVSELTPERKFTLFYTGYRSTAVVEGTLNSILNTDKLELISNDTLKNLLTAYPAEIKKFLSQQENVKRVVLEIQRPILESYVSLAEFGLGQDTKVKVIPSDFEKLLNSRNYQNALVNRMIQNQNLVAQAEKFLEKTNSILNYINREVQRFPSIN
ncbi:MAG: hypothetical protein H6570_16720 [Lewinellaceae bacterium]|nr:hypothetical protein [Lewinellaceae bacterium]